MLLVHFVPVLHLHRYVFLKLLDDSLRSIIFVRFDLCCAVFFLFYLYTSIVQLADWPSMKPYKILGLRLILKILLINFVWLPIFYRWSKSPWFWCYFHLLSSYCAVICNCCSLSEIYMVAKLWIARSFTNLLQCRPLNSGESVARNLRFSYWNWEVRCKQGAEN